MICSCGGARIDPDDVAPDGRCEDCFERIASLTTVGYCLQVCGVDGLDHFRDATEMVRVQIDPDNLRGQN